MYKMHLQEAIIGTVFLIPAMLIYRDSPPSPPSLTAEVQRESYKIAFKKLSKSKNYYYLLYIVGL